MSAASLIALRAHAAGTMVENLPSPCLSVCRMGPAGAEGGLAATRLCDGCFRTLDEIAAWGRMDDAGKRAVWALIARRSAGQTA